ncbi:MAG: GNAT family N-acetyltransferase [Phycisphaerales bacterium]
MTQTQIQVIRAPESLRLAAAKRLVSVPERARERAARQLLDSAPRFGIDLDLLWVSLDESRRPPRVGEVAMAVPGAGRTAMIFLSVLADRGDGRDEARRHAERVAVVRAALEGLARCGRDIRLAQALPEEGEAWSIRAFEEGGMRHVGELAYLQRPMRASGGVSPLLPSRWAWPEGVGVTPAGEAGEEALGVALERTYEETLDCPELCGLREISDVLSSHRATGVYDPARWWVVTLEGRPEGCVLMSHCPDQGALELVYVGLSPRLRGRRLGRALLERAIEANAGCGATRVTCAVDRRNTPALRMYDALGFSEFASRTALVCAITPGGGAAGR